MQNKSLSRVKAAQLMESTNGKLVGAKYIKKDGTLRKIVCRTGVKKYRKTTHRKSFANDTNNPYFLVCDMKKESYRVINLETLFWIRFRGVQHNVIEKPN